MWTVKSKKRERKSLVPLVILNSAVGLIAFLKDVLVGAYLGTTLWGDAWSVAFFIPDTIGNNLVGSALNSVTVPMFTRIRHGQGARKFYHVVISAFAYTVLLGLILSMGMYLAQGFILPVSVGHGTPLYSMTRLLLTILIPSTIFFIVTALGSAVLQSRRRFVVSAVVPLLFNVVWCLVVLYVLYTHWDRQRGSVLMAVGVLMAAVSGSVFVWIAVYRHRHNDAAQSFRLDSIRCDDKFVVKTTSVSPYRIVHQFVPYLVVLGASQVTYFVERMIASRMEVGTTAALNYAFRLAQFPNWIFIAALTSVLLPSLTEQLALRQFTAVSKTMVKALRLAVTLTIPFAVLLCVFRTEVITVLFKHGAFDEQSVRVTASILMGYSLSITAQAVSFVVLRYFLAQNNLLIPMLISIASSFFNIASDLALTQYIGPLGLGVGVLTGTMVSGLLLVIELQRRVQILHVFIRDLITLCVSNVVPLSVMLWIQFVVYPVAVHSRSTLLVYLVASFTIYLAIYAGALWKFNLLPGKGVSVR